VRQAWDHDGERMVTPLLVAYRPQQQSTLVVGNAVMHRQQRELQAALYAPYRGARSDRRTLTHLRVFAWNEGAVVALTRLSQLTDPVSGRTGLDVAIGAWLSDDAVPLFRTPCEMVLGWLVGAAVVSGYQEDGIDELDAILTASLEEDSVAMGRIEALLWTSCGGFPYASARSSEAGAKKSRRRAGGPTNVMRANAVLGCPSPMPVRSLVAAVGGLVDSYVWDASGVASDVCIEVHEWVDGVSDDCSQLPQEGSYRRLPDGGIVLY
jgi:hypothetical protein